MIRFFSQEEIGYCDKCGSPLELKEPFEKYCGDGMYCRDYGYASCKKCGKKFTIDDSFESKKYYKPYKKVTFD